MIPSQEEQTNIISLLILKETSYIISKIRKFNN